MLYAHTVPALDRFGTALLAGVSIASVVIGLAAQSTLANLVAGLSLVLCKPFRLGDRLEVAVPRGVATGTVETVSLGITVLQANDIQSYFETEHYQDLGDKTRDNYRDCANSLKAIDDTPAHVRATPLVAGIHDRAAKKLGWRRANMVRAVLSETFCHTIPKGLVSANYAKGVIPKHRPCDAPMSTGLGAPRSVLSRAKPHVRAVLALMMNMGLDPSGARKLRNDQIDKDTIWGVRGKPGQEVANPISPTLQTALDIFPEHEAETALASSRGQP